MTSQTANELESYLLKHIPISVAMGIQVESADNQQVVLKAPLLNNINHKNTAFGGSLHAVATLACWSLLHVNLLNLAKDFQIVIASSEIFYLNPVTTDFKATCCLTDLLEWERFLKTFQKKGKARIKLHATILESSQVCVNYSGIFAVLKICEKTA